MKKSSPYTAVITLLVVGSPLVAFAAFTNTTALLQTFKTLINTSIGILSALALLVFIWGIVKYISSAGDEDKAKEGKSIMIYGVIGLFVLFSVFGLVRFLQGELLTGQSTGPVTPPQVTF